MSVPSQGIHICYNPDDPGEQWKRTTAGCLDRLKECEAAMERDRGNAMNMRWIYWAEEWDRAFEWLQKRAPRIARKMIEEAEAGHDL